MGNHRQKYEKIESNEELLKLTALGTLELTLPVTFSTAKLTPKAQALLVYLMVTGKSHHRDQLAALFWREFPLEQGRKNLRYLLPDLRRLLGDYLLINPQNIAFNRQQPYWLDVELLRSALSPGELLRNVPGAQTALDLYKGEFLAGFTVRNAPNFEEWVIQQREELHTLVIHSSYQLAEYYRQEGDYHAALTITRRLLQWEPWHEAGHRLLMELFMALGQRTAALQHYALCQQTLAEELGVEPEAATTALYEQIRRGVYDKVTGDKVTGDKVTELVEVTQSPHHPDFGEPSSRASGRGFSRAVTLSLPLPHNIRRQLTSFVGREEEIADLFARLSNANYRVVTLLGGGGTGKTRLALAVAQAIVDFQSVPGQIENQKSKVLKHKFTDGVWFVPLNGLAATPDLADKLATTMAHTLHQALIGHRSPFEQLQSYLRNKRLLLVLDNVEHLLPGFQQILVHLLEHNPQITLLVTTRQRLRLPTEYVKRIDGLTIPEQEEGKLTPAILTACSSVKLFQERAQQSTHTFAVTSANQEAVIAICRFLGGLPLGIELAAAQTKYYTCEQIYQSLQQNSQLLATTKRDLPERHQNIRSVLDDSWRLLAPEAALVLSRLALFQGTFSLEAATVVADTSVAILSDLVDHSLLRQVSSTARHKRFLLHDLVRQYALEQLQMNAAVLAQTQQRYGEYFANLLQQQLAGLFQTTDARRVLQIDLHNIRRAWQWMVTAQQMTLLDRSIFPLTIFHIYNGSFQEMATVCEAALVTLRPALRQSTDRAIVHLISTLLSHYAYHSAFCGRLQDALPAAHEARRLAEAIDDDQAQMVAYFSLSLIATVQGALSVEQARAAMRCAYRSAESPPYFTTLLLADLGYALANAGVLTEAMSTYEEALRLAQEFDLQLLKAILYYRISQMHMHQGNWAGVYDFGQQALTIYQRLQYIPGKLQTLSAFVTYAYAIGDYEQVIHWSAQIIADCELYQIHDRIELAAFIYQGKAQSYLGRSELAHKNLMIAIEQSERLGNRAYEAWTKITLGALLLREGAWQKAQALGEAALAVTALPEAAAYRMAAQTLMARLAWRRQDWQGAAAYLEEIYTSLITVQFTTQHEIPWICLTCHELWGAKGDERAQEAIAYGYAWLQTQAAKISDEAIRQAFLHNVQEHRRLLALASTPLPQF